MRQGAAAQEACPGCLETMHLPLPFLCRKFGNYPKYHQVHNIPTQDSVLFSPSLCATENRASHSQTLAAIQEGGHPQTPAFSLRTQEMGTLLTAQVTSLWLAWQRLHLF